MIVTHICTYYLILSNTNFTYDFLEFIFPQSTFLTQISTSATTQMYWPPFKSSVNTRSLSVLTSTQRILTQLSAHGFFMGFCRMMELEPNQKMSTPLMSTLPHQQPLDVALNHPTLLISNLSINL